MAALPGAWRYMSPLGLVGLVSVCCEWGEIESLIFNSYLSVAASAIVWADPSLRYTSWDVSQPPPPPPTTTATPVCPGKLWPADPTRKVTAVLLCQQTVSMYLPLHRRERKIPGSNPACAGIFSGSSHTSDLKIGTPVATLPGAWRYRVSTGTGRPGVSIL